MAKEKQKPSFTGKPGWPNPSTTFICWASAVGRSRFQQEKRGGIRLLDALPESLPQFRK